MFISWALLLLGVVGSRSSLGVANLFLCRLLDCLCVAKPCPGTSCRASNLLLVVVLVEHRGEAPEIFRQKREGCVVAST